MQRRLATAVATALLTACGSSPATGDGGMDAARDGTFADVSTADSPASEAGRSAPIATATASCRRCVATCSPPAR